jgi:hypothetical protein
MSKIINLNPVFVTPEDLTKEEINVLPFYFMIIIQILIILFLLYFFLRRELLFVFYRYLPTKKKVNEEVIKKVESFYNYKISCDKVGQVMINNKDEYINVKYFNGELMKFETELKCKEFIDRLNYSL